jgi:hypothetical protein
MEQTTLIIDGSISYGVSVDTTILNSKLKEGWKVVSVHPLHVSCDGASYGKVAVAPTLVVLEK